MEQQRCSVENGLNGCGMVGDEEAGAGMRMLAAKWKSEGEE